MRLLRNNKRFIYAIFLVVSVGFVKCRARQDQTLAPSDIICRETKTMMPEKKEIVQKKVLNNGMTILVRSMHNVPKVSLQLWYSVGSKDEKTGERGIAHLIEHMIFKGTKKLTESDINVVSHKLSGSINAFTSFDYTGYLFNLPTHHWQEALPILADCMVNSSFKDDHLNSEMKAVIQELKMYRDDYQSSLIEELIGVIFPDHPYHYPIIGFKQDLWSVHGPDLMKFYKKHYAPNNATLVVVGDVIPEDVFKRAEEYFSAIPANPDYKKETFFFNEDIVSKSVTLYRDVQQPIAADVFVVPGISSKKEHVLEILSWILGAGKSSRLYKKIVDDLQLATSLTTFYYDLFDHALFFIMYEPKTDADISKIQTIIQQEIASILKDGLQDQELDRAIKKAQVKLYSILESTEKQAYDIGKYFTATGDENYIFNYLNVPHNEFEQEIHDMLAHYFRPSVMHTGTVMPLPESEKVTWAQLQKKSDEEDTRFLSARPRDSKVEDALYANTVKVQEPGFFDFPKAKSFELSNGMKVLYYDNKTGVPKINIIVEFKARPFYDSDELPGLYNFVMSMLSEGTENYSGSELALEIESRGMSFNAGPGSVSMSMLSSDLERGLKLLEEILMRPKFAQDEIEKVREQLIADVKNFWDEPSSFAGQLLRQNIYKGHPYGKNLLGTEDSINKITRKDIVEFYKKNISPVGARVAIVGDLDGYDLKKVLESSIGKWHGKAIETIDFTKLSPTKDQLIDYPINRDQVVLCYAGLSVDRKDPDYDSYLLFDQIFGSGALGSMHSRLFRLREQSGLFYSINGTMIANADEDAGMMLVKTIVSLDRLQEAEKAIKNTINTVADTLTSEELEEARRAVVNSLVNNFESNQGIARSFLFLDRFNFPKDFYDKRAEQLKRVDLASMKAAVKKLLKTDNMLTLRIGRMSSEAKKAKSE
jgi:zinc protease